LKAAKDGAEQVAKSLYDAQPGITQTPCILTPDALDDFDRPTRGFLRAKFAELEKLVKPSDRVIVYFGGHGIEVGGKSYLLLMDITNYRDPELMKDGSISVDEIRNWLNTLNCKESILLLDACRVESLEVAGDADINNTSKPFTTATVNAQGAQGSKTVTLFGCQPGERVYYGTKGLSFFSEALVEGLQGEGKSVDAKGQITMASLGAYVQDRVQELAKDQNKTQKPAMYPAVLPSNAWVLRPSPPVIACPLFTVNEKNDLEAKYNDSFTERFTTELVTSQAVALVERTRLDQVMRELKLQTSGLTNPESAKKLGQQLNADYLILGTVREVPGKWLSINVRLVETAFGQVVGGCAAACEFDPADPTRWKQELLTMADQLLEAMQEKGLTNRHSSDPGTLRIETTPPGARVTIDGKLQNATTPIVLKNLQPGAKVPVSIICDGYEEYTEIVTIGNGKPVRVTLTQMLGGITIKSTPPGAKVFIDGKECGVTDANGITIDKLPVGTYTVTVRQFDYREETQQVQVVNKITRECLFTLQQLPQPSLTVNLRCKTPILASAYKAYGSPTFAGGSFWAACATVKNTGIIPLSNIKVTYTFGDYGSWTSPKQYLTLAPGESFIDKAYPTLSEALLSLTDGKTIPVTVAIAFSASDKPGLAKSAASQTTIVGTTAFAFTDDEMLQSRSWQDQFSNAPLLATFITPADIPVLELADLATEVVNERYGNDDTQQLDARKYCQALYDVLIANNVLCKDPRDFLVKPGISSAVQYPRQTLENHAGTSLDISLLFASACIAKNIDARLWLMPSAVLVEVTLSDATKMTISLSGLRDSSKARKAGFKGAEAKVTYDEKKRLARITTGAGLITIASDTSGTIISSDGLRLFGLTGVSLPSVPKGILAKWDYHVPAQLETPVPTPPQKPPTKPENPERPEFL